MFLQKFACAALVFFAATVVGFAQLTIDGVADKANYNDSVTYRVQTQAGFTYEALLNGQPITVGTQNTITRPDFYELYVVRTETATGTVLSRMVRFLVNASSRNGSEWGLPPHVPLPLIQSSAAEFDGAALRVMTPAAFPSGYEIPVVAWTMNETGHPVRANGILAATGQPGIQLRRGVGSGFLAATNPEGSLNYTPAVGGIATNKLITIESATSWTTVSGVLGDTTWPDNSRIQVTGNLTILNGTTLTIGAGTIIRLNGGMDITNNGTIEINGTFETPVVFMPTVKAQPWGGFVSKLANQGIYRGSGVIFTGSGAVANWFGQNGNPGSHRTEQGLFYLDGGQQLTLTDAAAIYLAGQLGHSRSSSTATPISLTRFLMQRCTTGGEYTGANFTVNDGAFIECPDDTANFVDGDNDGLYVIGGIHAFTNTLFGWTKDDGVDSGGTDPSGNFARLSYQSCWFEATFHESNSLSGYKNISVRDTVYLNCGQGIEDGYNAPTARVDRCYFSLNKTGARHGDNYPSIGNYDGRLTVTNSILLQNHRDLFGFNWRSSGFTNSTDRFFANDNFLTRADTNFPNNFVWNPATDAARLTTFGAAGRVGMGLAIRAGQTALTNFLDGIPVVLSMFSSNEVTVAYRVETSSGARQDGTLTFRAGEMRHNIAAPANIDGVIRVTLSNPQNADLTGISEGWFQFFTPPQTTPLVSLGSTWRYRNDAVDLGTAWRASGYDDSAWASGPAEIGFGENDQATTIANNLQSTTYFRHSFTVANPTHFGALQMRLKRDDAGVVFINGNEVYRSPNLPSTGTITYSQYSSSTGENTIDTATIPASALQAGVNVIAVEIHQADAGSSDISFDFELIAQPPSAGVRVEIGRFGNAAALFWRDATYRLQESSNLNSTWSTLPGTSPLPVATDAQRFYRLTK
ncbi:MAG: hypothetical protein IPK15_22340 [Verrucomicrobia bacterium]|nr:hypothetical protein [Verrucomicrobiota bacterium]